MRSPQPLIAATALIRGSNAAPIKVRPPPRDRPVMPRRRGSAEVWASVQSMTEEMSATSVGPATSTLPPESQNPRTVYVTTT